MQAFSLSTIVKQSKWGIVGVTLLALAGCQSAPQQRGGLTVENAIANCSVEKVQHYLGNLYKEVMEHTIRAEAGAEIVRVLGINTPATKDYRHERLTIYIDRNNRIFSMSCG